MVKGNSALLPFDNHQFDVVTCMLSRWSVEEIYRVLKPNGVAIIEHIGCEDKKAFKLFFGKDKDGWRGQFLDDTKDDYLKNFYAMVAKFFKRVTLKNGFWHTFYTKAGLLELLMYTPVIRDFDKHLDKSIFQLAVNQFLTEHGIKLQQNRILMYAEKI